MSNIQVWKKPRRPIDNMIRLGLDDTNTPYPTNRRAFRQCATGTLRLHAAEMLFRPKKEEWHCLILRLHNGIERAWFYRDETVCRSVYATWAGHGDPDGFDFSFETYTSDRPEISMLDVFKSCNPLIVSLPAFS